MTGRSRSKASRGRIVEEARTGAIQAAALRVISKKGLASATMEEIAAEAGIAKGTIYLYFKSRGELVERSADATFDELLAALDQALGTAGSFEARLAALVRTKIEFFDARREFFRFYLELCQPQGDPSRATRQKRAHRPQYKLYLARLMAFLQEAMARSEIARADPQRLALFLNDAVNAIVLHRLMEEAPPAMEDDVAFLVGGLLHGIANTPRRGR